MMRPFGLFTWFLICLLSPTAVNDLPPIPATPKKGVTGVYHGVKVVDDYRWLEDWNDPTVRAWSDAQNSRARAYLDALPMRAPLAARLKSILEATSGSYRDLEYRGATLFGMKTQPPKQQPFLVTLRSADDTGSERVLVDPNQINPKGTTAIDFYVPSLDGRRVAVSMSENGTRTALFTSMTSRPAMRCRT